MARTPSRAAAKAAATAGGAGAAGPAPRRARGGPAARGGAARGRGGGEEEEEAGEEPAVAGPPEEGSPGAAGGAGGAAGKRGKPAAGAKQKRGAPAVSEPAGDVEVAGGRGGPRQGPGLAALVSTAFLGAALVAALAAALGPWLLAQPVFLEPGEIKDVMLRLGKVESQLRSVTAKLSGLASQKDLEDLQRKYRALEAAAGQVEGLAGGAREAEARLRAQADQAERGHADLGRRIGALEASMDQKVAAAAKRADGQAEQLQGAVEKLEGRVVDHELLTRKTLDGWRGRPVLRREDLQAEMEKFAADRTGRADWALYWAGGRVIDHSALWARPSDLYTRALSLSKELPPLAGGVLTLALGTKVHSRASQWLLEPTAQGSEVPGHCLALRGSTGFVDVRLRARVRVDAVSIEHIPHAIAYDTSSAPREVELTGWQLDGRQPSGEMRDFGRHVYSIGKRDPPIQVFDVQPREVDVLRLQLLSNHGHQDYTCIYRLRVHGEPSA